MLWTIEKPSLKHFHILGCLAEARPYRPNEDKLDSRTNNCYFIEYFERSRGYKFYDPIVKAVFETGTATFFKDVEFFFFFWGGGGGEGMGIRLETLSLKMMNLFRLLLLLLTMCRFLSLIKEQIWNKTMLI